MASRTLGLPWNPRPEKRSASDVRTHMHDHCKSRRLLRQTDMVVEVAGSKHSYDVRNIVQMISDPPKDATFIAAHRGLRWNGAADNVSPPDHHEAERIPRVAPRSRQPLKAASSASKSTFSSPRTACLVIGLDQGGQSCNQADIISGVPRRRTRAQHRYWGAIRSRR